MNPATVDLKNPDLYVEGVPHEVFSWLRRNDPVHWNPETDGGGFWSVTRYDDVVTVSKQPEVFSSDRDHGGHRMFDENVVGIAGMGAKATEAPMISMDPPVHNQYRRMVSPGFSPARIRGLEERIRARTRAILDRLDDRRECEFVSEIAAELPVQVLAELLGVPQGDRLKLFEWANSMVAEDDPELRKSPQAAANDLRAMAAYSVALWQDRRAHPGDDLISMLAHSTQDGGMSMERYLGTFVLLVVAGNETTRNSISGGLIALAEYPDQRRKLIANRDLLPSAAAEIVRWISPVIHMRRTAIVDTELRGKKIRTGDKVILWYPSANRDEAVFTDPFAFDVARAEAAHLGFGIGQHYCLGARLAELQLRVFFDEFLSRYPDAAPIAPPRRMRSNFVAGIKELRVRLR
ncbi:MAG TPA: cytochrome P450 [Candidatus Binataceae bacterium]|nr:cytochrome P450 [Candidatus Binataceae bacterium]